MNNNIEYVSVTELNRYLYYKFDQDDLLKQVYLEGELSNCKKSGNHYYFSLKDQTSEISGMFFYPANLSLTFIPRDGMSVKVAGRVQVYQKRGTYAVVVTKMSECGVGLLYTKYLELKEKLDKEGLFLESHKLPIPDYPEVVGIITAATGEAINDIVSTFNRRFPLATLKLFPALVQGSEAPKDLIRALDLAYLDQTIDCLIIGRGGGSFEDLNCFNDEALARKLYDAPFPTISAVGHEGDYTICDFVCSFRAPTPTGAAMRLTKEKNDVLNSIFNYSKRLSVCMKNKLISSFNLLQNLQNSYGLAKFDEIIKKTENKFNDLNNRINLLTPSQIAKNLDDKINNFTDRLNYAINQKIKITNQYLDNLSSRVRKELVLNRISNYEDIIENYQNNLSLLVNNKIDRLTDEFNYLLEKSTLLNPLNIIKKGYTIIYKDESMIYDVDELQINDKIKIKFNHGYAFATVDKLLKEEE